MKFVGFALLPAGWFLVLASLVLLGTMPVRTAFVASGMAVEVLGLMLVIRSHLTPREDKG